MLARARVYSRKRIGQEGTPAANKRPKLLSSDPEDLMDQEPNQSTSSASGTKTSPQFEYKTVLEPNPKWRVLEDILQEIRENETKKNRVHESLFIHFLIAKGETTVLVLVKDEASCQQLKYVLNEGPEVPFLPICCVKLIETLK